ncbi:ABC transporter permease [Halomarina rubra]|uniref:ABC transporter permease n=1 Tax=Halomarina rubra TaxID=2071873 RepID=A0ABD6ASM4_9EURY|nr:ABC transporter permease [Halomarina rubra]
MRRLRSLLRKEVRWSRHNLATLVLLLLVLPGGFVYTTTAFDQVIPRDSPVAVVPASEQVSDDDLDIATAAVTLFSEPRQYEDSEAGIEALRREQVYAVLEVPPDLTDETATANFTFYVDGSIVPYHEASEAIVSVLDYPLQRTLPADVSVEREVVGPEHSLSEYLVPVGLLLVVLLFAFAYVPYNLANERRVLDRLEVEASLEAVVASKLLFFGSLLVVPMAVVHLMSLWLGYANTGIAPAAVLAYLLTFFGLAALSTAIMLLFRFGVVGRFVNIVVLFGLLAFSNTIYPAGFFSPVRREIARLSPLHYSTIVARSSMLKGMTVWDFLDWFAALAVVTLGAFVLLELSIVRYRRVR